MISSLTPEIIYEDKDIIVCHKPAGVPTQSSRIGTKDMVSILKNHLIKNTAKKNRFTRTLSCCHPSAGPTGRRTSCFCKNTCCRKGTFPPAYHIRFWEILPCTGFRHFRTQRRNSGRLSCKRRTNQHLPCL